MPVTLTPEKKVELIFLAIALSGGRVAVNAKLYTRLETILEKVVAAVNAGQPPDLG